MIEVKNISRKLGKFGLKNVSFKIPKGKTVAFVGDNGAGKTTTIKALFGELRISEGEILIEGKNIFEENNLRKIAFFPDTNNVPLNIILDDYLKYICAANGINKVTTFENIENTYSILGLRPYRNKKIKELSAGWKKKAIMASVLIRTPEYIVFDEPTANLDVDSKLYFMDLFKLLQSQGITMVITSHIIDELQEIADYMVLIKEGTIVYEKEFDKTKERIIDIYEKHMRKGIDDLSSISSIYG